MDGTALSKLRGLLSSVYQGNAQARKSIENAEILRYSDTKEDILEILELLEARKMFPDDALDALFEELGEDALKLAPFQ